MRSPTLTFWPSSAAGNRVRTRPWAVPPPTRHPPATSGPADASISAVLVVSLLDQVFEQPLFGGAVRYGPQHFLGLVRKGNGSEIANDLRGRQMIDRLLHAAHHVLRDLGDHHLAGDVQRGGEALGKEPFGLLFFAFTARQAQLGAALSNNRSNASNTASFPVISPATDASPSVITVLQAIKPWSGLIAPFRTTLLR